MAESILIVDDEVLTLNNLKKALGKEGYEVLLADSGETGIATFKKHRPNLVLADLMLPGIDGIEVLKQVKTIDPYVVVIMMTAYEIIEKAIQAMKIGAFDYVMKPFKISDLKISIARAIEIQKLRIRVSETVQTEKGKYFFDRIIARNKKMIDVIKTARKVSSLDKTAVLLTGESGTGKGLMARAIHYNSPRANNLFIAINCAAIPESLLESELFGYEAGAFTDARRRKIGLFEKADRGTIFLDEIADMPIPLQAKLLKAIEDQSFTRLGATTPTAVDIRIISATNSNLKTEIDNGNFREDLFYRLNVVPILIPPLRERREDIIPLALAFINEMNTELHRNYLGISEPVAKILSNYNWPGNVRELRNVIERIMALYQTEEIEVSQLPMEIRGQVPCVIETLNNPTKDYISLEEMEKQYIKEVLQFTEGNKSKAAQILGIHFTSLLRKLKKMQ